jgi:hypothetical protein
VNTYSKRAVYLIASFLVQTLILFLVIIKNNFAVYGSNDDALIANFSIDGSLGSDKNNWIFIKSLFSIPLTFLQNYFGDVGVYGLFLGFVIILSVSALITLISFINDKSLRRIWLTLMSLVLFLFSFFSLLNPTYTGAAIFSGAVGFGLLLFVISVAVPPKKDLLILSGVLIAISYVIRFESFLLSLGFFTVLLMITQILNRSRGISLKELLIPALIFFLVSSSNFILDRNNYSSEEWKDFLAINDVRHQIHLRTAEYVLGDYLSEIGWSESDYGMFRKFSLADQEKLNLTSLDKALEVSGFTRGVDALVGANYKNELIFINYSYLSFHWLIFLLLILFLLVYLLTKHKIKYLITVLFILILGLAINYVFAVSYHMPDRLTFNILFMLFVGYFITVLLLNLDAELPSNSIKLFGVSISVLFIIIFTRLVPGNIDLRIEQNQKLQNIYSLQREYLLRQDIDQVFIGTGSRLIYAGQSPYKKIQQIGQEGQNLIMGWHNLSPIWRKNVSNVGLDAENFHKSVLESNNVYILENSDASTLLLDFYDQYSTSSIELLDTGFLGTDFYRIFKLKTAP